MVADRIANDDRRDERNHSTTVEGLVMSNAPKCLALLNRVATRLRLITFGRRFYLFFLVAASVYVAGLIASRLLGLQLDWFRPATLALLPLSAALLSLLPHQPVTSIDAARRVDRHRGTKDLFLAMASLDNSAGHYQTLVVDDAEHAAERVNPSEVVPFHPIRQISHLAGLALVLLLGALYLPQFDPFGKVAQARQREEENQELKKSRKATEARITELKKRMETGEESKEIKTALDDLKLDLRKMKPTERQQNLERLGKQQKSLGKKWRELSAEKLRKLMSQTSTGQGFGLENNLKVNEWTQQLQEGMDAGLKQEMNQLKDAVRQAMQSADPVKREKLMRDIQRKLRDLEELATKKMSSPELAAAVKRAMEQLEAAQRNDPSGESMREAMQALQESIDLTKMELEQIAQSASDLKSLEEALKVIQQAKQVNDQERLDGEATANLESLGDYAQYYAEMMGEGGEGQGGLGGQGFGEGGEAPEDDSVATDFQSERAKAAVKAGKVLMTLKSKGVGESGEVIENRRALIDTVREGYSEAIVQEQIPPGYHDSIRNYFDTIAESDNDATSGESADDSPSE